MTQYQITDWSDDFLVGIQTIDEQHRKFFRLAHHFYTSCLADEGLESTYGALKGLGNYAARHFATEEAYMKKIKYTDFEEHKKFHDEFMAKFHEMEAEFMSVGPTETLVNTILMITMDWLKEHIVEADFKYAKNG